MDTSLLNSEAYAGGFKYLETFKSEKVANRWNAYFLGWFVSDIKLIMYAMLVLTLQMLCNNIFVYIKLYSIFTYENCLKLCLKHCYYLI